MPKALEQELNREANSAGLQGDRKDAYVYGTMRKTGWTPSKPTKPQAEAMVKQLRQRK